jgi:hypothetical protein
LEDLRKTMDGWMMENNTTTHLRRKKKKKPEEKLRAKETHGRSGRQEAEQSVSKKRSFESRQEAPQKRRKMRTCHQRREWSSSLLFELQ